MKINLKETEEKITELFNEGMDDEQIAKELNAMGMTDFTDVKVSHFRNFIGLVRRWAFNLFEESRSVEYDDANGIWRIKQFSLPDNVAKLLGLDAKKSYSVQAELDRNNDIFLRIKKAV